jgi:hypothetical protein
LYVLSKLHGWLLLVNHPGRCSFLFAVRGVTASSLGCRWTPAFSVGQPCPHGGRIIMITALGTKNMLAIGAGTIRILARAKF